MQSIISALRDFASLARHLAAAMRKRKAWWMVPLVIVLLLILVLVVLGETPLAPFIYTLF